MNLPKHVYAVKDRHGKTRYRFRKGGLLSAYLPAPTSSDFWTAYEECFNPDREPKRKARPRRPRKGSHRSLLQYRGRQLVYFIGTKGGLVKIGTTVNLPARLKKLQTGAPSRLILLACVDGGPSLEAEYHARFADLRRIGEWFRNAEPIRAEIQRLQSCQNFQPKISNPSTSR